MVGVNVPVHVVLSLEEIVEREPLGFEMSELVKTILPHKLETEQICSEKTIVTVGVSPILTSISSIENELTAGGIVSTMYSELSDAAPWVISVAKLPAKSVTVPLFNESALAPMLMPSSSFSPDVNRAWIVYRNNKFALLLPEVYVEVRLALPTTIVIVGLPLTTSTVSLKVAVSDTTSPGFTKLFCLPVALVIPALSTVGGMVSTL